MTSEIPLLYKDRRTEGDTILRQAQLVQLHLLHVIDCVCEKHHLTYWLAWGSCLGAMRHRGFIPWDDDLDIGMPMADYKKFIKVAPMEFPRDVYLHTPEMTPHSAVAFAKVRDAYSCYYESRPDVTTADPSGIYVDVFPMETVPNLGILTRPLIRIIATSWNRRIDFANKARNGLLSAYAFSVLSLLCLIVYAISSAIVALARRVMRCVHTNDILIRGAIQLFDQRWFESTLRVPFEDGLFPVPVGADEYLTCLYHDWHQIPPPDRRPRHARVIDPFHSAIAPWSMEYPVVELRDVQ